MGVVFFAGGVTQHFYETFFVGKISEIAMFGRNLSVLKKFKDA
jgi:hypothetical protein